MKKLFTLALVVAVLSVGGIAFANDSAACAATAAKDKNAACAATAAKDKTAKAGKHLGLDKQIADLEAKKAALLAQNAQADTKEFDAKIDELKNKIAAKKTSKKADKKADKKAATADTAAPAPAAQ